MAASLEELRSKLTQNPSDLDVLARLEAECVETRDLAALREGYGLALDAAKASADVVALITRLAAVSEKAGMAAAKPREAVELLLRSARLQSRAPLSDRESAATSLAAAWSAAPDHRLLDAASTLLGDVDLAHAPEYLTFARAQLVDEEGPGQTKAVEALHVLAGRHLDRLELERSRKLYERLVELRPDDARIKDGLAALETVERDRVNAFEAASEAAQAATNGPQATQRWIDVGLAASRVGKVEATVDGYRSALAAGGEDDRLEILEDKVRAFPDGSETLVRAWTEELARLDSNANGTDPLSLDAESRVIAIRRKLYRVLNTLGRTEEAAKLLTFERAIAPPSPAKALAQAERLEADGEFSAALAVLGAAERGAPASNAMPALVEAQARILAEGVGNLPAASKYYQRLKLADPRNINALQFFRRLHADQEQADPRTAYTNLAQLYAALPTDDDEASVAERVSVAGELATRAAEAFDAPERTLDAWRRVIVDAPAHPEANEALRHAYIENKRWHALVDHLEGWAKSIGDTDPEARIDKLFEVIETYQNPDKLDQDELVVPTYRRIVALSPKSVRALDRLAQRYEDASKWKELLSILHQKVEVAQDTGELLKLFSQISQLYLEQTQSPAQAIEALERMLELDPGNIAIVRKLRDVYVDKHDTERIYDTYKRELDLLDGQARKDVLVELGELATEQLFKHGEAVDHWKAVVALDPKHERANAALAELNVEQTDWPSHAEALKKKVAGAKTRKEKVELLQELGETAYARLDDEEAARKIFAEICEISPFNTKARTFLQKIYVARRAWGDLSDLYAPRGDWKGYVTLLGDFGTKTDDPALTADIYAEMARVHDEELEDPRRVISSLEQALEAMPTRVDIAQRLLLLYPDNAPAAKRMTALETIATHAPEDDVTARAWQDLSLLRTEHHDPAGAFTALQKTLVAEAGLGRTTVLEELAAAAESGNRWQEYANSLSAALSRLPDAAEDARIIVHRALAVVSRTRLMDVPRAISHYACLLQLVAADDEALSALEEMYLGQANFGGLEEVLRTRATLADDDEQRLAATLRLGELYDDALADAERAAECYETILQARPDDVAVLDRLRATLSGAEAWGTLARSLEVLVVRAESPEQLAKARHELATLYLERLNDPGAAIEEYRALLAMDSVPDADSILLALEQLFEEGTAATACAPLLEKLYRRKGDAAQLIKVLLAKSEGMPVGVERLAVLDEIALLASTTLDEPKIALKAQLQRFVLKPTDVATWNELEALAERCDGHGTVAARWQAALEASQPGNERPPLPDARTRNALRRRLAHMFSLRFGAPDVRITLYEAVLAEAAPQEDLTDVYEQLERLYQAKDELEKLVEIQLKAADAVLSPVARRQKLLDAANLMVGRLGRAKDALPLYEELSLADPADEDAFRALKGLYQTFGEFGPLAALLERRTQVLTGERLDETRYRRASILRDEVGDLQGACGELCKLVSSETVGAAARSDLLQLATDERVERAQLAEALKALDAYHADADDPLGKVEVVMLHAQETKKGQARARVLRDAGSILVEHADAENERLLAAAAESLAATPAEVIESLEDITDDDIASAAEILDDETLQVVEVGEAEAQAAQAEAAPAEMLPEVRSMADRAFAIYARALHEWPGDRETADAIEALAGKLGVWEKFARIMAAVAPKAGVPAVSYELWEREARAAEDHLGDLQRAIDAYSHVLDNAKASSKEALRALDALDRLYATLGENDSRIRVLRMKRAAVKKPTMRLPLLGEEAKLLHQMGRGDEALIALKAILQATQATQREDMLGARKDAQQHVATLLEEKSEFTKLVTFLEEGATEFESKDVEVSKARLYRAAELSLVELKTPEKAIALYERVRAMAPGDETALAALDTLYQGAQRWEDKTSVLEERIAHIPDGEAHSEEIRTARFTLGQLLEHRLGRPEDAQQVYREVLAADPNYVPALRALEVQVKRNFSASQAREILAEAHRTAGRHAELVATLEARIATADLTDVGPTHFEIARIQADFLGDASGAWPHAVAAYRDTPAGDVGIERRAVALAVARRAGQQDALVELLLEASSKLDTAEERQARRQLDRETLQSQGASRGILAKFWRAILEDDPRHSEAIAAIESHARESGSIEALADLLSVRAAGADNAEDRRQLRGELATLFIDNDRPRKAVTTLEGILSDSADDGPAFEMLARIYNQLGEAAELADLLERRRAVAPAEEIPALQERLAGTWWHGLDDPGRAVDIYAQLCAQAAPPPTVVRALESMWNEGLERERLFALLAPIHETSEDWERLVALLDGAVAGDGAVDLKIDALTRKATIEHKRLGRPASAYGTVKALVKLMLENDRAAEMAPQIARVEEFASETNNWTDLLRFYETIVASGAGDAAFVSRLGTLWAERGHDNERAITAHRAALARDPHTATSRDALTALLTDAQRWEDLARHLGASAETHFQAADKLNAYRAQARILRGRLGRPAEAVEALRRAVAVGLDEDAYQELARLLSDLGQHEDLQAHYRQWREKAQSDEQAWAIQVRLALSLLEAEATVGEAVKELEDVITADPGNASALDGLVEVLDRADALEAAGDLPETWKKASVQTAKLLEEGLGKLVGDVTPAQKAARVRAQLRSTTDDAARLELLRELGPLQVAAGREADAFKTLSTALPLAPLDESLVQELERLAEAKGLQGRLLAVYVACLEQGEASDPAVHQQYALKVGRLLFEGLGKRVEAASYLEIYIAAQPDDIAALRMLAQSYREANASEDEARVLSAALSKVEGSMRVDVGKRLGVLRLDVLNDPKGAMEAFDAAMPTAAQDPDIARRLEGLYGNAGNFEGLAQVYDAALSADPEMQVQLTLLAKKAQVHEMRLSKLEIAADACRAILEWDPKHRFALTSLTRIEEKREEWEGLESILERRLPTAKNNTERVSILSKRAVVLATHLDRPAEALEAVEKANELDSVAAGSDDVLAALESLLAHSEQRGGAAAMLEPRYAARKDWRGLTEALRVQAETVTVALERVKLAVRTAQIQEARLDDKAGAIDTLSEALKALIDDEVRAGQLRKQLELTAKRCGLWAPVVKTAREIADSLDGDRKLLYLSWLGRAQRDGVQDLEGAIETFESMRSLDDKDPAVIAELEALYRQAGRTDKLRALLDERLAELPEADRPRALLDMAYVLVDQDGFASVVPMLEQVLSLDENNVEARQLLMNALAETDAVHAAAAVLEPRLRAGSQWAELVAVLAAKAKATKDLAPRARVLEAMGDLYLTELESPQKAFAAYAQALDDDGSAHDILGKLGRATHALGAWKEYTQVLQLVITREEDGDRKRDLLLQLAQIVEVRLGHVDKAAGIIKAAYELAPNHHGIVTTYVRLQRKLGLTSEVLKLAEAGANDIADPKIRQRLWRELYDAATADDDQGLMLKAAEQSLEIDPYDHVSAERLIPLYTQQRRFQDLEQLLLTQADGAMDAIREASLMLRLGQLREGALKDVDAAVEAYSAALELNPSLDVAAQLLERHYREQDRFGDLFDVLRKRAESLPAGSQESVATYMEIARLAEDRLDDLDQAIAAYETVVSFETGDQSALDQLIRICHRNGRYDRLAELYELKALSQNAPGERRYLTVLAAEIYAVRLKNMVKAESLLKQVRAEDPDNPKASVVLAQIQAERGDPARAVALLERLLGTTTGPARFDILLNLGRLHKEKLDQPEEARRYLSQARNLQASNAELNALLTDLFGDAGDWEGLKAVLESEYESTTNERERYECALSLARLHRQELKNTEGFLHWVGRAQEDGRQRREVVELLIDHFVAEEQWTEVATRLEWLVNYLEGKKLTSELPVRANQLALLMQKLDQQDKALQYHKLAVSADPSNIKHLRDYGTLLVEKADWERALKVHQSLIMLAGKLNDDALTADVLVKLAQCSKGVGNEPKAKQYLKRLIQQQPEHAEAKKLLEALS